MATYEELHGKRVEVFTTDPTLDSSYEGQVWFNSTEGVNKTVISFSSVTSKSGISRGTTSSNQMGSFSGGSADAMAVFGGNPPAPGGSNITEEFDGNGWSSGGNMVNSLFNRAGFGTLTAGVAYGGRVPPGTSNTTEHYNGSSWTAANAMPEAIRGGAGGGPQTAGIVFSGHGNPTYPIASNKTKYYDGTNWTVQPGTMNTSRSNISGCGIQTAALAAAGEPNTAVVEEWNGSSWTTAPSLNSARVNQGPAMMQGTSSDAVILGGNPPYPSQSRAIENWDGTSWTTNPVSLVSEGNSQAAGQGSSASSVSAFGGSAGSSLAEQFNKSISTITAAAWSSGGALPGNRWNTSGAGTQTAGLIFGGATGPATPTFLNTTFEYNGASWTAGGTTPNSSINQFSAGIQTAAIGGGGLASGGSNTAEAYTYNGSTWTAITATPIATKGAGAAGTSTACLIYGSDVPSSSINQDSYLWNGSSWAEEGAMNTNFQNGAAGGPTENTAFKAGSLFSGPETSTNFETYNGSAWTAGPSLITTVAQNRGFGSSTECLSIGGTDKITPVERYNGTAWQTSPSLATGRKQFASANFTAPGVSNGWVGGGANGDASVEHFTEQTSAVTSKTLTTS